ncbi:hypothetical protein JMA_29710 [Jeotgalibacillus malaysiensis]|uniref:Uncharacterized protein n=1 Tax=Jeotgalibacillus malaysiensis TaxID=1508404 RepID=A0A0B5AUK3_9BACL|nr:hypothetical protein [Jeotgalibacillus malaysiensis]AJD92288.1 hypothetical protein JMA_29710 [Jeotgalibacillus malaysiensis]
MEKNDWFLSMYYSDLKYEIKGNEKKIIEHLYLVMDQLKEAKDQENRSINLDFKVNRKASEGIQEIFSNKFEKIEIDTELRTYVETLGTRIEWIYCLGIACYIVNQEENFLTAKKLRETYIKAGIKQPQNIHLSINQCVRKGFMKEIGKVKGLKAYIVTNDGMDFIDRQVKIDHKAVDDNGFEDPEQKEQLENFYNQLSNKDHLFLKQFEVMEERILIMMFMLKLKNVATAIRPNFMYLLMVKIYGYDGLPRSVHLGLSRTRPLTKKIKWYNKIHYQIEKEGIDWAEDQLNAFKS